MGSLDDEDRYYARPDDEFAAPLDEEAEAVTQQLELRDAAGHLLQRASLGSTPLSLGSHPGNDLALEGEGVGRFHLRLSRAGDEVLITDLGTRGGTLLDGQRLAPNAPQAWQPSQLMRIGPFVLRLADPAGSAEEDRRTSVGPDQPAPIAPLGQIAIVADPTLGQQRLIPGQLSAISVMLINRGNAPDEVRLQVSGLPEGWVSLPPKPVHVEPGTQALALIGVNVPRSAESLAGDYAVVIQARSGLSPNQIDEFQAVWGVEPFEGLSLDIRPRTVTSRGQASYVASILNSGNQRSSYRLSLRDDAGVLDLSLSQAQVTVDPGKTAQVRLTAQPLEPPERRSQLRNFTLQASTTSGLSEILPVQLKQMRAFPAWAWPVGLLALLLLLVPLAFWLLGSSDQAQAQVDSAGSTGAAISTTPEELDPELAGTQRAQEATSFALQTATAVYLAQDDDRDGLRNDDELGRGTAPDSQDTDNDGLPDAAEIRLETDPLYYDTDGDGLPDGEEVTGGLNPRSPDSDGDGLSDAVDPDPLNSNPTPTSTGDPLLGSGGSGGTGGTGGSGGTGGGSGGTGSGSTGGSGGTGSGGGGTGGSGGAGGSGSTGGGGGTGGTGGGSGGTASSSELTPTITLTPSVTSTPVPNRGPLIIVAGQQEGTEDTPLTISGVSLRDPDIGDARMLVSVAASRGAITFSSLNGLDLTSGSQNGGRSIAFRATITDTLAALSSFTYLGDQDYFGADQITIIANDLGASGPGGPLTDTKSVPISLQSVNDLPLVLPSTLNAQEGQPAAITRSALWAQDPDTAADQVIFTITNAPGRGRILRNSASVGSFTQADIDAGQITYVSNVPAGERSDSFKFVLSDGPRTGIDLPSEQIFTILIGGTRPIVRLGTTSSVEYIENKDPVRLNSDQLSISDPDTSVASARLREATISIVNSQDGVSEELAIPPAALGGLNQAFTSADGVLRLSPSTNSDAPLSDFELALRALTYINRSDNPTVGVARLVRIVVVDSTGLSSDPVQVSVVIKAANDPVVIRRSGPYTGLAERGTLAIGRDLLLTEDPDNTPDQIVYTIVGPPNSGQLLRAGQPIAGSFFQKEINDGLISYASLPNRNPNDSFSFTVSDPDGPAESGQFVINIDPFNDQPFNQVPAAQSLDEDGTLRFQTSNANLITVSDPDVGAGNLLVRLEVLTGTLQLGSSTGLSLGAGGSGPAATLVFSGTVAALNDALNGLAFRPPLNYSGNVDLIVLTTDSTGGPPPSDSDSLSIEVRPINDAPVFTDLGVTTSYSEGATATVLDPDVTLTDVDLQAIGSYGGGLLTISRQGVANAEDRFEAAAPLQPMITGADLIVDGVIVGRVDQNDGGLLRIEFTGGATQARVNQVLNYISYRNSSDQPPGVSTVNISFTFDDRNAGAQGAGGLLTTSGVVGVSFQGLNSPPILTNLNNVSFTEQSINAAYQIIDNAVSLSDDSVSLGGGRLIVEYSGAALAEDNLSIITNGPIAQTGGTVSLSGTAIGTITAPNDGQNGAPLIVNLNAAATPAAVEAMIEALAYRNSSDQPQAQRGVVVRVDDGAGATSTPQIALVSVVAENDPPTISAIGAQTTAEDTTLGPISFTISDPDNAAATLILTVAADNPALVPAANLVFGGGGNNRTLTITPAANQAGSTDITITVSDGQATFNRVFTLTVTTQNDPPTITPIFDQFINEDGVTVAIPFTIGDTETLVGGLTVAAISSNPTLVPVGNIVFGGAGANRTVTITPLANQFGAALITITVDDGTATTDEIFTLTVNGINDPPTITAIADQNTNEDVPTAAINFTITDSDNPPATLNLSATSSNPGLVPVGNIVFGGTAGARTVTITPAANQSGASTITITVSDGALSATSSFILTVNPTNDPPTITPLNNLTINEDTVAGPIAFIVDDAEVGPGPLTLTAASSNPGLVPVANIVFGGAGANRTVTVTPLANQSGNSTITITVNDGALNTNRAFQLNVMAVNDPLTISVIADQATNEDVQTALINFTITDADGGVLPNPTATSSNPALIPVANIAFGGAGANRTVTITPAANQSGASTITITVNNGTESATTNFVLTVAPVNDAPTDLNLSNNTIAENLLPSATVGTFNSTDADGPGLFTYTLVGGAGSGDNGLFTIIDNNRLVSTVVFDYEAPPIPAPPRCQIRVRVTDGLGGFREENYIIFIINGPG